MEIIINNITIVGRIGKKPELRYKADGKAICNFNVAVNRKFQKDITDWFRCVAFGKTGELIEQYLDKGREIAVQGEIQFGEYTNDAGNKVPTTSLVVNSFDFIGGNGNNGGGNNETAATNDNTFNEPIDYGDMPF